MRCSGRATSGTGRRGRNNKLAHSIALEGGPIHPPARIKDDDRWPWGRLANGRSPPGLSEPGILPMRGAETVVMAGGVRARGRVRRGGGSGAV